MPHNAATGELAVEGLAPASRAVAGVLGDANLLPVVATAGLAVTAIGRVPPLRGGQGGGDALRVRVLDAPEFRPGDTVDLHDVGGATVGYLRAGAG